MENLWHYLAWALLVERRYRDYDALQEEAVRSLCAVREDTETINTVSESRYISRGELNCRNAYYSNAYNNRGSVRQVQGDPAGAIADYDQAIVLHPGYSEAYSNRGTVRSPGRPERCGGRLRAGVALDPPAGLGLDLPQPSAVRYALGDAAGVLADFDQAPQINPDHIATYSNRGSARHALGNLEGALADFDLAIRLTPRPAAALLYHNRAGVRITQHDFAAALADYQQCWRSTRGCAWPTSPAATPGTTSGTKPDTSITRWRSRSTRTVAAREVIRILAEDMKAEPLAVLTNCNNHLKANPRLVTAYIRRGLTLLLLGRDDEAEQDLSRIYELVPAEKPRIGLLIEEARRRRRGESSEPGLAVVRAWGESIS